MLYLSLTFYQCLNDVNSPTIFVSPYASDLLFRVKLSRLQCQRDVFMPDWRSCQRLKKIQHEDTMELWDNLTPNTRILQKAEQFSTFKKTEIDEITPTCLSPWIWWNLSSVVLAGAPCKSTRSPLLSRIRCTVATHACRPMVEHLCMGRLWSRLREKTNDTVWKKVLCSPRIPWHSESLKKKQQT